eukprot:333806-Amphidinium_carterae.2
MAAWSGRFPSPMLSTHSLLHAAEHWVYALEFDKTPSLVAYAHACMTADHARMQTLLSKSKWGALHLIICGDGPKAVA